MGEDSMRSGEAAGGRSDPSSVARRKFIVQALSGAAISSLPALLEVAGVAQAAEPYDTRQTLNGVAVFFVPGPDPYSVHQGQSTPEPGGLEAGAGEGLYQGLNSANPFVPNLSDVVAGLLNATALAVNPGGSGPFASPFSNLSFAHKATVFQLLEGNPASAPLVGLLPAVVAFLAYAETAVFNPATRTISGRPIGWNLSSYSGVSNGRDEFKGYFRNVRKAHA